MNTQDNENQGTAQAKPGAQIDVRRCLSGMKNLYVHGAPDKGGGSDGSRKALIEEAVSLILKDGAKAMAREFLGFKQYAQFGDQRTDCEYGMGPRHGSIVFNIGRTREGREGVILGADEIYLLECVRDFGSEFLPSRRDARESVNWNLIDIITHAESLRHDLCYLDSYLFGARVEEQCAQSPTSPEVTHG